MNKKLLLTLLPLVLTATGCNQTADPEQFIAFDYIYTAQPVVFATRSTIFKNVQDDFKAKSNNKVMTQASIFVKNTADQNSVNALLDKLENDITAGLASPAVIKTGIEQAGSQQEQQNKFGMAGAVAFNVTNANNGLGLGFQQASTIKDDIFSFVNLLTNNAFESIADDYYYEASDPLDGASYADLKILAPSGAPSVAFYNFATSENFTTTTNPKEGLIPMFKKDTYDVIVAPTQGGLTQIVKQQAEYKVAATITFGNFYLISTGRDEDNTLNKGDKVCYFQKDDVPGKVFNYVYGDLDLFTYDVAAVSDTKAIIENNGVLKL